MNLLKQHYQWAFKQVVLGIFVLSAKPSPMGFPSIVILNIVKHRLHALCGVFSQLPSDTMHLKLVFSREKDKAMRWTWNRRCTVTV